MKNPSPIVPGCHCCLTRRRFLTAGCSVCLGTGFSGLVTQWASAREPVPSGQPGRLDRPRVRLVFACWAVKQDRPTWPHIGYDFAPEMERVSRALKSLCPEVEFLPALAHSAEDAKKLLAAYASDHIDGYLVYHMNNWVSRARERGRKSQCRARQARTR